MKKIYFISGLGADSRTFSRLSLPENTEAVFLDWIDPLKNESMNSYARRLSEKINTSESFMLIGLSFGGMLATEMLEYVKPKKAIIISSIARKKELPWYFRLGGSVMLHRLIPSRSVNRANRLTYRIFGLKEKKDKELLDDILTNTNTKFTQWCVHAIITWKRKVAPENIIRISGGNDRLLPIKKYTPQYLIPDGGHLMVLTHAKEVSEMIAKEITP